MRAFGLALTAIATLALAGSAQGVRKVSPACAAAEVALQQLVRRGGEPLLFSTELQKWNRSFADVRQGRAGISVGTQPTAALSRFDHTKLGTALDCANVRARAETLGEVVEEAAGEARLRSMGLNGKTAYLWRVALPVLDRSGGQAVVAALASSNQLAGGSELVFLTRQRDGSWKVTGGRILSMA